MSRNSSYNLKDTDETPARTEISGNHPDADQSEESKVASSYTEARDDAKKERTSRTEYYKGIVKGLDDSSVLVTVSSPGDWDRWDARIPLASFDQSPQVGQEFSCTITIYGSDISIRAKILQDKTPRTLKDFGIDKEELLEWASKIDV